MISAQPALAQMAVHGTFDVGDDGSAQYAIAIPAPPGITALQPHLSLAYLSTGGNGLLGMGWSLAGLSSVSRCPRTWAQDGLTATGAAPGGIHFDDNDRLCLDGQRLIQVASTSNQGGTEFRTEIDSFSRIIAFGTDPINPTYIQVESKSGLISTYGQTTNSNVPTFVGSTITRQWALNSVRDRFGHTMTVTYTQNIATGDFRPAQINYAWPSDGVSTGASVVFRSTTRPDVARTYVWGSMLQNAYLISEIDTQLTTASGTRPVTQYHLNYIQTGSTVTTLQTSLLDHIQVCAGATPDCTTMQPVQFTYTTGTAASNHPGAGPQQAIYFGPEINWTDQVYPGDFFGDGIDALLVTASPACVNGNGNNCWQGYKLFRNTGSGYYLFGGDTNNDASPSYQNTVYVVDLLGTGRPGIVVTTWTPPSWTTACSPCGGENQNNYTVPVPGTDTYRSTSSMAHRLSRREVATVSAAMSGCFREISSVPDR